MTRRFGLEWITAPALLVALLVLWQAYVSLFDVSPFILPPPGAVGLAIVNPHDAAKPLDENGLPLVDENHTGGSEAQRHQAERKESGPAGEADATRGLSAAVGE